MRDCASPDVIPSQVAYFYDDEVVNHNYGGGNPMRPHRARLTMELVKGAHRGKTLQNPAGTDVFCLPRWSSSFWMPSAPVKWWPGLLL